jgi:hypothetical protein
METGMRWRSYYVWAILYRGEKSECEVEETRSCQKRVALRLKRMKSAESYPGKAKRKVDGRKS